MTDTTNLGVSARNCVGDVGRGPTSCVGDGLPSALESLVRKPISPRLHGVLDYMTSTAVAAAPLVFDFPKPARRLFESLAAGYTGLSAVTNYPLSVKRLPAVKGHGAPGRRGSARAPRG